MSWVFMISELESGSVSAGTQIRNDSNGTDEDAEGENGGGGGAPRAASH